MYCSKQLFTKFNVRFEDARLHSAYNNAAKSTYYISEVETQSRLNVSSIRLFILFWFNMLENVIHNANRSKHE